VDVVVVAWFCAPLLVVPFERTRGFEMRKQFLAGLAALALGTGIAGCSNSSSSTATTTAASQKAAFCGGNIKIDKASANVTSNAGFLTVLKDNKSALTAMADNLPSGTVGTDARQEVTVAREAIASGNVNDLNTVTSGGAIDTYCGVDGNGDPLPAYFGTGKGTSFCSTFIPIFQAVSNANSSAAVVAVFNANKAQVAQLATEVSGLPASIKAKASTTVSKAQAAITEQNAAAIQGNGSGAAAQVALYCGQNQ
jgi:hypothetical protein